MHPYTRFHVYTQFHPLLSEASPSPNQKSLHKFLAEWLRDGFVWNFWGKPHPWSCVTFFVKKLTCPYPPNSMLLHSFAWKGLEKTQPFRFWCRHALVNNIDQGGTGGSGVMWPHVGGWMFFFEEPGISTANPCKFPMFQTDPRKKLLANSEDHRTLLLPRKA